MYVYIHIPVYKYWIKNTVYTYSVENDFSSSFAIIKREKYSDFFEYNSTHFQHLLYVHLLYVHLLYKHKEVIFPRVA